MTKKTSLTQNTYSHKELVMIASRWAKNKCGVVCPEFVSMTSEIPDVIAFNSRDSYMIEVKVSRADFLRDKKKHFRRDEEYGMGNYRYYCTPKGMIDERELPDGWGLIQVNNGKPRLYVHALRKETNLKAERILLYCYARRAVVKGHHDSIMTPISQEQVTDMVATDKEVK